MTEPNHQRVPLLQKMEIADILDTAIRLYRHNFTLFMEIVAVVQVFLMAIYMIGAWSASQTLMATGGEEIPWKALVSLGPLGLLYIGGWILLFPVSEAALAFAVSETYLGRRISVLEAYQRMWPLVWRLLGTMILVSIVILLGTSMCLIPGLLVWVWFAITTPIVALERTAGPTAMDRSYRLVVARIRCAVAAAVDHNRCYGGHFHTACAWGDAIARRVQPPAGPSANDGNSGHN